MIRSARIPSVLRRICTDNIIQTALLVTTDGELLGSTATTFVSPDGTSTESIESLGTLIADIAIDYGKLGDEYANLYFHFRSPGWKPGLDIWQRDTYWTSRRLYEELAFPAEG